MRTIFETQLNGLYQIAQCPIVLLDLNGDELFKRLPRGKIDLKLDDNVQYHELIDNFKRHSQPILISKKHTIGGYCFPDGSVLLIGPINFDKDKCDSYYKNKYDELKINAINEMLKSLAWCARRVIASNPPLEKNFGPEYVNELTQCQDLNIDLPNYFDVVMIDRPHNCYAFELLSLDAITLGDANLYCERQKQSMHGINGTLAYTQLRARQNLAICHIVLCSRAAIAGGLNVEQAYTMADYLILSLEHCTQVKDVEIVSAKAGVIFAHMVYDVHHQAYKSNKSLCKQALNEIKRYLYIHVSRKNIAQNLNVNPDYLDRVLKENIGCTIYEYLKQARLEEAKRLLLSKNIPIYEIASLLLFSSSSHFARAFKQYTGLSPKEYKEQGLTYQSAMLI